MKRQPKCSVAWLVIGLVLVAAGITFLVVTPLLFDQNLLIKPGSFQYKNWVEPLVPVYMQWYIFNLTNADQVLANQAKPKVEQLGPYTYREYRIKENITWNGNGTVTYENRRYWIFEPSLSNGLENDSIVTANLPLVTVANSLVWESELVKIGFSALAQSFGESLFKTYTMHDLIWGYHDPMMKTATELFPDLFYTDFVGVYAGKNYTNDGVWTVETGVNNLASVGMTTLYNGSTSLPFWTDRYGNMVNGTDGTVAPPGISMDHTVYFFVPDLCRSLYAEYIDNVTTSSNILLYRYTSPENELANSTINPANGAFCTPRDNCLGAGMMNLTICQTLDSFNIPVVASLPHFLYADKKYLNAVEGLSPDPIQHRTDICIEPKTGMVMRLSKRMQINIHLESIKFMSEFSNIKEVILPVVWLNESAAIDKKNENVFHSMMNLLTLGNVGGWVAVGFGTAGILLASSLLIAHYVGEKRRRAGYEEVSNQSD